jgi:hypothetical protein
MEKINCAQCGWSELYESMALAAEGLAQHYLKEHPDIAHDHPLVQAYAMHQAKQAAPTNGAMTVKHDS